MAYLDNSAKHMLKNVCLPVKEEILQDIKRRNALETVGRSGWPRTYYNNMDLYPVCNSELTSESKKRQKTSENEAILLSKYHCILVIVLSKKCRSCLLILPASTLELGLVNLGDTLLLSFEIMYSMQHLVRFVFFVVNRSGNVYLSWKLLVLSNSA